MWVKCQLLRNLENVVLIGPDIKGANDSTESRHTAGMGAGGRPVALRNIQQR